MQITNFFKLLRPQQWYKNSVIFLAIVFSNNLLNLPYLYITAIGFLCLCALSSSNYILNDIIDRKSDRQHPEKSKRPLASGSVKIWQAVILMVFLLFASIAVSYTLLGQMFLYSLLAIFCLTSLYSAFLKNLIFIDVILISANFVIRAISGAFIIKVWVSPWLVLGTFFLALFLVFGKRRADLEFLGEKAGQHKAVLKSYSSKLLSDLMAVSTSVLIVAYALYCMFGSKTPYLLTTLPVAVYILFRYLNLTSSGKPIARKPELIFRDLGLLIGLLVWAAATFVILYAVY